MIMESKTTSKTSLLKALLLRAWRERWSDVQWGINIKTVLPRGVSGDVYNLADCILQQAVIGSGANQLVLSYLKHSLSAQLVSHEAVLARVAKFSQFHKTHCVSSLLDFLEGMLPGITCCGKSEETKLAGAVLATTIWLLQVMQNVPDLAPKSVGILQSLLSDKFYMAMMCLAKSSEIEVFDEMCKLTKEIDVEGLADVASVLARIDTDILEPVVTADPGPCSLIQAWLSIQMLANPGTSVDVIAQRLRLFQTLLRMDDARMSSELMRGSFLCLNDVSNTQHESQWGAFTFIKVPSVLAHMNLQDSIMSGLELLLQHSPLLDYMDTQSSCSSFECLLTELVKTKLITDQQSQILLNRRQPIALPKVDAAPGIPKVIICAEPTLTGILKTLSTDYHKMQDALLGMLHQILAGKSFELILAVATVQGQLKTFVQRLIRFNEYLKVSLDKSKSQLFDISFLMLVAIVQLYGAEVVLDPNGDSLFENWVSTCMVEAKRPKAPGQLLKRCNPAIVEQLIRQFNSGDSELVNSSWHDVLFNMSGVMREVLIAWEQGVLAPADVKRILDAIRGKMCSLPLAAAAWLCAYMRTAHKDTILKPVNMVQQLLTPPEDGGDERWQLTSEIIRKMQRDIQLPIPPKSGQHLVSKQPAMEQLSDAWSAAIERGWLDCTSARNIHCLYDTAGSYWFVNAVIQQLMKLRYKDQLHRGVEIALAAFHVDIRNCVIDLLTHSLPQFLYNALQSENLMEPQLSALAKLTSFSVYAALDDPVCEEPPAKKVKSVDCVVEALKSLLSSFRSHMQDGNITQQTYFTFHLLESLVEVRAATANKTVLCAISSTLVSELLHTLPEMFAPSLIVKLHDTQTAHGRANMAKDLCTLRNYQLRHVVAS